MQDVSDFGYIDEKHCSIRLRLSYSSVSGGVSGGEVETHNGNVAVGVETIAHMVAAISEFKERYQDRDIALYDVLWESNLSELRDTLELSADEYNNLIEVMGEPRIPRSLLKPSFHLTGLQIVFSEHKRLRLYSIAFWNYTSGEFTSFTGHFCSSRLRSLPGDISQ